MLSQKNLLWKKHITAPSIALYRPTIPVTTRGTTIAFKWRERIITRLRLGKCRLNNYLYNLKLHPSGLCDVCGSIETVEHYLLDCVNQTTLRCLLSSICRPTEANLGLSLHCPHTILNNHDCLKQIYAYIVSTCRRL